MGHKSLGCFLGILDGLESSNPSGPIFTQNFQNRGFLLFFLKTMHWNFLIFCTKPSLWSRKKSVSLFCQKFKNDPQAQVSNKNI